MEKNQIGQLNLGLDVGTNSVGWALLDENMKLVCKNGFTFWGVRMFNEAKTASETRGFRNSRRRLERRKNRLKYLRDIFSEEIGKVDSNFFMKMEDSFFRKEDKRQNEIYDGSFGLFKYNPDCKDEDDPGYIFYKLCPTIYHLRSYIINANKKVDSRLIYLALHNLIKYRGHFLIAGDEINDNDTEVLVSIFNEFNELNDEILNANDETECFFDNYFEKMDREFNNDFINNVKNIVNDKTKTKSEKKKMLVSLFGVGEKTLAAEYLIPLLLGRTVDVSKLTPVKPLKYDKSEIDLYVDNLLEQMENLQSNIPGYEMLFQFTNKIKAITDYFYLKKLLKGETNYLCEAMINKYEEHNEDLKELKLLVKKYIPNEYNCIFRDVNNNLANYPKYVGINNVKKTPKRFSHANRSDFYKFIKQYIIRMDTLCTGIDKTKINEFLIKIENNDFLLKQRSDQNGSIPMQFNLKEIKAILNNQKKYYPFLENSYDGVNNIEKIISIFKFKIPYYVGPLATNNEYSKNSWLIKKDGMENEKIYPWNFDKIVDKSSTALKFINRMQTKCAYLKGEKDYCLPKSSMIFSEYNCLSYLNKIKINGEYLPLNIKNGIFERVFKKKTKPTKKDIIEYLKTNHGELQVSTSNGKELQEVECNMSSYVNFSNILGEDVLLKHFEECEEIIKYITLFEDKDILVEKLKKFSFLNDDQKRKIKGLNYNKWSNLSRNLIDGAITSEVVDESGEVKNKTILQVMRETNINLMELLNSEKYQFGEKIDEYNSSFIKEESQLDAFIEENIYTSPTMLRSIKQAINIIDEIEKIFDRKIDNFYIECARTNKAKKNESKSRYEYISELYTSCKEFIGNYNELDLQLENNKNKLKQDKLYLYFTQLGKSMYTGLDIDINKIDEYDIDHIYPQALIKDDSLSNRVLVERKFNTLKSDRFLYEVEGINISYLKNNLWNMLLKNGLISKKKYQRLTNLCVHQEELEGFIERQIVSTNQSVKALCDILKLYKNVNTNNIIFSKAENVSMFRKENGLVKSRLANNYHHAHDAYLNVIVGSVLNNYYKAIGVRNLYDYDRIKSLKLTLNPLNVLRQNRSNKGSVISNVEDYKNKSFKDDNFKVMWNVDLELGLPTHYEVQNMIDKNGECITKRIPIHSYFENASINNGRIYYDLYKRFDVNETIKTNNKNLMFMKVTIKAKGEGSVPLKSFDDPRSSIEKYGGYTSASYSRYTVVKYVNKKDVEEFRLVPISRMNDSNNENEAQLKIANYLKNSIGKYKSFEVLNWNIKTNCVLINNNTKSYITGVTPGSFLLMNKNDRNFCYNDLVIIKKIEKYNNLIKNKAEPRIKDDDTIVLAEAKNNQASEITLTRGEIYCVINSMLKNFKKEIYRYSSLNKIAEKTIDDFKEFDIINLLYLANGILSLLMTNSRQSADLKLIGLSSNSGILTFSPSLAGCKLIAESVTGYYKKVLFEG